MIYSLFAIVGSLLILFGFYRISIGKWTGKSLWYELDNFIGALLVSVYQIHHHVYITATLNIVWVLVALKGITSYEQRRPKK
jgi:hypothetical protein